MLFCLQRCSNGYWNGFFFVVAIDTCVALQARILSEAKTIRMHYANCGTYNADFDGDEINLHYVQNKLAHAEAQLISNTDNQYIIPTSGRPIRGLIQDHVCGGVLLTMKDTFLDREQYHLLVYGSLFHLSNTRRIELVPPCILKPQPLWSGKQVVSNTCDLFCPLFSFLWHCFLLHVVIVDWLLFLGWCVVADFHHSECRYWVWT